MEQLAQARLAAWQGGSLWLLNTTVPGVVGTPRTDVHAHHAVQIVIGLGGEFRLWAGEAALAGPYAAVAPDAPHRFDARGAYAILFVEPESRAGRAIIAATFGAGALRALPPSAFDGLGAELAALRRTPAPRADELAVLGRALVEGLAGDHRPGGVDPRIRAVLARIAPNPDEAPGEDPNAAPGDEITLAAAARIAGLSPSRLSHLFVAETGLTLKTYRLWVRLSRAVRLMTEGVTLTAVAHEAGFADSAHFSRTFRRMFGVAPANLVLV